MAFSMIGTDARRPDAPPSALPAGAATTGVLFTVLAILTAAGLGALALVSAKAAEPVLLGLLAILAMVGSFFLFGLAAGHIRIGNSVAPAGDVAATAADLADPGIMITARDGAIVYANATYNALAGVDGDGEPRPLETAFAGEPQAAECLFRLLRAAELGEARTEEFRVRALEGKDRAARWLRVGVRPIAAGPDSVAASVKAQCLWQVLDVTSDRAREAEVVRGLETEIARYEAMPVGVLRATAEGRIVHLNATLCGWLGLDREAIVTRELSLGDIVAGNSEALILTSAAKAGGQMCRLDLDLLREDGAGLPVEIVCRMDRTAEHGQMLDILAIARASAKVPAGIGAGAEARYERLFQSAPFGIATLGPEGTILGFNAAFARMFDQDGLAQATTVGRLVGATGDADAVKAVDTAVAEVRLGRPTLAPIEISFGPERQQTRRFYLSPIPEGTAPGEAALLYVIDATEQKALELKYAQSTKMEAVGKLAGGIAHDFNNVLTAIIGFSDLLLQTHRSVDPAHRDIMNIKKEAVRAAGLVRQLLAFSRRQTLMPEVLDLNEVATEYSVMMTKLIGEKVTLKIASDRDLWHVKADRTQLEQVLMNLAVNARDAMPTGGKLTIRTRNVTERASLKLRHLSVQPCEYVMIEVEDTGTGMPPEVMAKIFEPFFSTKDVGKGTGLGLSTVYGIVKQTGGYVFPESAPGKGTTFRVYLPRHEPDPVTAESAAAKAAGGNAVGRATPAQGGVLPAAAAAPKKTVSRDLTGTGRVLLVEDEDSVRSFAVRALRRQGYEVLEATTGAEALDLVAAQTQPIDLVVSDVVMPEMDGPTMLTEMRKSRPDLKVIFVSGYPDDRFKNLLDPDAQFAFLPKPFTLPQLAEKVKEEMAR
jgi:two-component system cell cycle sensor histidine kinase/response regulator CckA